MEETRVSYAQNGEDVVLWRALGHVDGGRYVDVGANHPVHDSVTWLFCSNGWRGVDVEPVEQFAALLESTRPDNDVVRAVVSDSGQDEMTFHEVVGTGLSTSDAALATTYASRGFSTVRRTVPSRTLHQLCDLPQARDAHGETHFLKIDVEGDEASVLRSADFRRWRPWVVVVEATRPLSTEPSHAEWEPILTAADYRFCLFDGLSRYYVAEEHAELAPALSYPFCPLDPFTTSTYHLLSQDIQELRARLEGQEARVQEMRDSMRLWRTEALRRWGQVTDGGHTQPEFVRELQHEVHDLRTSTSWRLTAPLRAVSSLARRVLP